MWINDRYILYIYTGIIQNFLSLQEAKSAVTLDKKKARLLIIQSQLFLEQLNLLTGGQQSLAARDSFPHQSSVHRLQARDGGLRLAQHHLLPVPIYLRVDCILAAPLLAEVRELRHLVQLGLLAGGFSDAPPTPAPGGLPLFQRKEPALETARAGLLD